MFKKMIKSKRRMVKNIQKLNANKTAIRNIDFEVDGLTAKLKSVKPDDANYQLIVGRQRQLIENRNLLCEERKAIKAVVAPATIGGIVTLVGMTTLVAAEKAGSIVSKNGLQFLKRH